MLRQLFGRIKTASKGVIGARFDALDLLRSDHVKVEKLAVQLRLSRDKEKKKELLAQIRKELGKHMLIEEKILYPACAQVSELHDLIDHSYTDHQLAKNVLKDLAVMDPSTGQFNSYVTKLILKLEHHVHEEEDIVFSEIRKHMRRAEFDRLNRDIHYAHRLSADQMMKFPEEGRPEEKAA